MVCDLYKNGTNSVNNMCVVNTEAKSNLAKTTDKCIQEAATAKEKMYLEACLQKRRHFPPSLPLLLGYWMWRWRPP